MQQEMEFFTMTTERWYKSFQPLYRRSRAKKGSKDFLGASILKIKYLSFRVASSRLATASDDTQDTSLRDYISIVNLASDVLEAEHRDYAPKTRVHF